MDSLTANASQKELATKPASNDQAAKVQQDEADKLVIKAAAAIFPQADEYNCPACGRG